jgi:hypothetical protein
VSASASTVEPHRGQPTSKYERDGENTDLTVCVTGAP